MDAALEAVITDAETAHLHTGARRHIIRVGWIDAPGGARKSGAEGRNAPPTDVRTFRNRVDPPPFVSHSPALVGLVFEIRGPKPPRRVADDRLRERRKQERVKLS